MPPWQLPLSLALFLSLSYTHTHTLCVVLPSTRLTCLSPSSFSLPFCFCWSVRLRRCAPLPTFTYHNTQWKNVVSLSNYKIRRERALRAAHFLRLLRYFLSRRDFIRARPRADPLRRGVRHLLVRKLSASLRLLCDWCYSDLSALSLLHSTLYNSHVSLFNWINNIDDTEQLDYYRDNDNCEDTVWVGNEWKKRTS